MNSVLDKIHQASLDFLTPLSLEETCAAIVKEAIKLVKAERGSISLEDKGVLRKYYVSSPLLEKLELRGKGGFRSKALTSKKSIVVGIKEAKEVHPLVGKMGIRSVIFVPFINRQQSIGVLVLQTKQPKQLALKKLKALNLFGSLASLAIKKTQLYDETKKAVELRDLFISMASHELRTPLTSINGYIQLLYSRLALGKSMESKWIKHLYWESVRMTKLIDELLKLNQIKTGKLQYDWNVCHLKEVVDRTLTNSQFTHPERKIKFIDQLDQKSDTVIGDFDKLVQVITNIVENSIKFSSPETKVEIILKENNHCLVLSVKDMGQGIAKSDKNKIFNEFYKGKNNYQSGIGLGLYLCKNIIQEHKGDLKIKSKINMGTTVDVKLPKAKTL